jgi:hypothetical protein
VCCKKVNVDAYYTFRYFVKKIIRGISRCLERTVYVFSASRERKLIFHFNMHISDYLETCVISGALAETRKVPFWLSHIRTSLRMY